MSNDQQSLIQNSDPITQIQQSTGPLAAFVGFQVVQFVWFIISTSHSANFFFLFIQIAFSIINFIACQRYFGRQLVGLSWKFELKNPTEFFWVHEIEPDPFVPTKINSNAFWVVMAGSSLFWLFATLFSRVIGGWLCLFVHLIIFVLSSINLVVFFKIERISAKLSANAVRTVLLGKSEFPDAEEFSSSDDNENTEKKVSPSASGAQETTNIDNTHDTNNADSNKDQENLEENNE